MKTDPDPTQLIKSDLNDLKIAAKNLINHASKIGSLSFGTSFLKWVASFSAMSVFVFLIPIRLLMSIVEIRFIVD